jgi:two-component system, LuxR family, response regulator FixJ
MSAEGTLYVIDDDDAVRDSIDALCQSYGISVRTYPSGAAFMRDLPAILNGCLLIDLSMPGANGLELLDRLRRCGITLPAIIMIGSFTAGMHLDLSDSTILEKPTARGELLAAVERALGRYHA